jgi:hypothetical protein
MRLRGDSDGGDPANEVSGLQVQSANWGDTRAALDWLATAERTGASALERIKVTWLLDPVRNEPEFKALEQRLHFPP